MLVRNWLTATVGAALLVGMPVAAQQKVTLPEKDQPLTLAARTLFQVGEVDGEDYENFAGIADLAFDARGNLYILDGSAYRVIVFDADGRFLRVFGRQGGGPGEFGFPTALAVLPSGELVVNDAVKGSLQLFNAATGEFLRTATISDDLGRAVGRMRASPRSGIITETMQTQRLAERRTGDQLQMPPRSVSWLTFSADGASGRRLYNAAPRQLKLNTPTQAEGSRIQMSVSASAFEPSLLWTPLPDGGVAATNSEQYRITLTDDQGRPLRFLERKITPRPVTDALKKKWLERRRAGGGPGGGSGVVVAFGSGGSSGHAGGAPRLPAPGAMRVTGADIKEADVNWGDVVPVLTALNVDSWGRLWAQRSAEDLGDGPIDIIDASGRYLGTLASQQMPRAFGPGGRAAYIVRDDLDVQRVVVKQYTR